MATTSHAPAGQTYSGIEEAGKCTLRDNANGFPNTDSSSMLPPQFRTEYPDPRDETGDIAKKIGPLNRRGCNTFVGKIANANAEDAEYAVFQVFEKIVNRDNNPPLLVIRNFELDRHLSKPFHTAVLSAELRMNFNGVFTRGEFDTVVFIKNVGLLLIEIKSRHTVKQLAKAEDQLKNGALFFQHIYNHLTSTALPVVKMVIFSHETSPSPNQPTASNTHIIHKDILSSFSEFDNLLNKLCHSAASPVDQLKYEQFVNIMTGMWLMEPYNRQHHTYQFNKAASISHIKENDKMVSNHEWIAEAAKKEPDITTTLHNVELNGIEAVGASVVFLTPEQKNLLQNVPQALVRGAAGTGKTILMYLKILDITRDEHCNNKRILIIAPDVHALRVEKFVTQNGIKATMCESFPPPPNSADVIIITLDNFFQVDSSTLTTSYLDNVKTYNVFIDDIQSLEFRSDVECTFDHVAYFIDQAYVVGKKSGVTLWILVDVGQSRNVDIEKKSVASLLRLNETTPRSLNIPIYPLKKVMRNSLEILTATQRVRSDRVRAERAETSVMTDITAGHRIRSSSVKYNHLAAYTRASIRAKFVAERLKSELTPLLKPTNTSFNHHDIAIISDNVPMEVEVEEMLNNELGITRTQSIKEFIVSGDDLVIFDKYDNIVSFECAVVVYLRYDSVVGTIEHTHYNVMTRARTKLVVIDLNTLNQPPLLDEEILLTRWDEKSDGSFHKK